MTNVTRCNQEKSLGVVLHEANFAMFCKHDFMDIGKKLVADLLDRAA